MSRICITGAAGFIGFHLASALADDHWLMLVDNFQRGKMDTAFAALLTHPHVTSVRCDLTKPVELPTDFDEVYHLAAVNGTKHFYQRPYDVLHTNVTSLINVLEWTKTFRPRLLFTSSNEAYAGGLSAFNTLPLPTPEGVPLVVEDPYNPRWSYAATKLVGELFVISHAKHYAVPSVIVRPHNFYGPRSGEDHVIPELIRKISDRVDPFPLLGADETRSFCYIADAVDGLIHCMALASTAAPTLHIGSAVETGIYDLAEELFRVCEWHPALMDLQPSLPGSVRRRLPDVSKIATLTGWAATTPLSVGLKRTARWYER